MNDKIIMTSSIGRLYAGLSNYDNGTQCCVSQCYSVLWITHRYMCCETHKGISVLWITQVYLCCESHECTSVMNHTKVFSAVNHTKILCCESHECTCAVNHTKVLLLWITVMWVGHKNVIISVFHTKVLVLPNNVKVHNEWRNYDQFCW